MGRVLSGCSLLQAFIPMPLAYSQATPSPSRSNFEL
jgi:hypothetical protein